MIKIRYRDPNELSPGLFAAAESHGRDTTVYLLPGLTPTERHAALRRLRLSARMGHDIRLPTAQLALALVADVVRTGFGRAGAVFRSHPAGSTVPVMMVSAGAIAFLLLSAVSIHVLQPTPALNQLPPFPVPSVSAIADPVSNVPPTPGAGPRNIRTTTRGQIATDRWTTFSPPTIGSFGTGSLPGGGTADGSGTTSSGTTSSGTGSGATSGSGSGSTGTGSGSGTGTGTGSGGGTPTPAPTPTPSMTSSPVPSPSPSPSVTPTPAPVPTPTPSPGGTGTGGDGNCLDVGPLGICLDL